MPDEHLRFPTDGLPGFTRSFDAVRCLAMQGGQGEVKHWAFNDPPRRTGQYQDAPPPPGEYRKLADHPNVQFSFFRGGIGSTAAEMH